MPRRDADAKRTGGAPQRIRSAETRWDAAQYSPPPGSFVAAEAPPPPDPRIAAECNRLTARLRDGEGKLKNLGFDPQVRRINGLPYERSGPIIAKALMTTQSHNGALTRLPPERCVEVAQRGLAEVDAILAPLAGDR